MMNSILQDDTINKKNISFILFDYDKILQIYPASTVIDDFLQITIPDSSGKVYAFGKYTYVSSDTGKVWIRKSGTLASTGKSTERDFDCLSETNGYYCLRDKVYKTGDGGNTWRAVFTSDVRLCTIDFLIINTGIVMGGYGSIFR